MSNLDVEQERSGKACSELPLDPSGRLRLSLAENSWVNGPGVRLQFRGEDGHLCQGPEILTSAVDEIIGAEIQLLRRS